MAIIVKHPIQIYCVIIANKPYIEVNCGSFLLDFPQTCELEQWIPCVNPNVIWYLTVIGRVMLFFKYESSGEKKLITSTKYYDVYIMQQPLHRKDTIPKCTKTCCFIEYEIFTERGSFIDILNHFGKLLTKCMNVIR